MISAGIFPICTAFTAPSALRTHHPLPPMPQLMSMPLLHTTHHPQTACRRCTASPQMMDAFEAVGSVVGTAVGFVFLAIASAAALWVLQENKVAQLRAQRMDSGIKKGKGVPVNSPAYVRPREAWREEELKPFDGSESPDGPILLAADGVVYNVSPARGFYGPGGEYSVMAGRDASRFLGKNSVEEATDEERAEPLNVAERASLSAWAFSFKSKYDVVGRLATAEEAAMMLEAEVRDTAYMDQLEQMSQQLDGEAEAPRSDRESETSK